MLDAVIGPEGEEILPQRTLPYDTLILCLGSVSNDFGVPGASEHPISLDTLDDAERFHRRLLARVRARRRPRRGRRPAQVNIVIIGAGATGVELAAEIRQTTRAHAAYGLDNIDPRATSASRCSKHSRDPAAAVGTRRHRGHRAPAPSSTSTCAQASA